MMAIARGVLAALIAGIVFAGSVAWSADWQDSTAESAAQFRLAGSLQNAGQHALAAEEWEAFLKRFPRDKLVPQVLYFRGVCYRQTLDHAKAVESFEQLLAVEPTNTKAAETMYQLGGARFDLAKASEPAAQATHLAKAVETLDSYLKKFPQAANRAEALFLVGESNFLLQQPEKALVAYAALVKDFPKHSLVPVALYNKGVAEQELGQDTAATSTFIAYLDAAPQGEFASEVRYRMAGLKYTADKLTEAADLYEKVAADKGFRFADEAQYRLGVCRFDLESYPQAAIAFAEVIRKHPQSQLVPRAWLMLGRTQFYQEKYADAAKNLQQAFKPTLDVAPEAGHWMAQCYLRLDQPQEALTTADEALALPALDKASDTGIQLAFDRADALYELPGRRSDATEQYARLAKTYPDHRLAAEALYLASLSALKEGQNAEARAYGTDFVKRYPDSSFEPDVLNIVAESLLVEQKYPEAVTAYRALRTDYPEHPLSRRASFRHGIALYLTKAYRDSIAALDDFLATEPPAESAAEAQYWKGRSLVALEDLAAARDAFAAAMAADANWREADETLLWWGYTLRQTDNTAEALRRWTELRERFPESKHVPSSWRQSAETYMAAEEHEQAAAAFQKFLATNPDEPQKSLARFDLARSQVALGQSAQAVSTLETLLKENPDFDQGPFVYYELAWSYRDVGKVPESTAAFEKLAELYPDSEYAGEAMFHVAEQHYTDKKFEPAAEMYLAALKKAERPEVKERAAYKLGLCSYQLGRFEQAAEQFGSYTVLFPQGEFAAVSYYLEGDSLFELGKYKEAIPPLSTAVEAFRRRGPAASTASDQRALLRLIQAQAEIEPVDWAKNLELSELYLTTFPQGDYVGEVLYQKAFALQETDKLDEAKTTYLKVADATQREVAARAFFMHGQLLFAEKDHQEAVRSFFRAAYVYNYPKWQALSLFEAGRCFEVLRKPDQAKKVYEELITKFAEDVDHQDLVDQARKRLAALGG
jgi:TolA-binding protein